jgi:cysteine dioxygenase
VKPDIGIKNLDDLFGHVTQELRTGRKLVTLEYLLRQYNGIDWKPYKYFTPSHYSRFTLKLNDILEMVIICWEPGQKCTLHDHPRDGCLLKILQGEMKETVYELASNPRLIGVKNLMLSDMSFLEGNVFGHEMHNISGKRAVSLHLYSPPNYRPNFYL